MKESIKKYLRPAIPFILKTRDKARSMRRIFFRACYRTLFFICRYRINKFDKITTERDSCFTIELQGAGFTDQITKFVVFYSFGKILNCKYYYTPFISSRSANEMTADLNKPPDTPNNDVYDFLGVHDYLKNISTDKIISDDSPFILGIEESHFLNRGLTNIELIASYLKIKLYPLVRNQPFIHIKIIPEGISSFFGLYNKLNGCPDSGLDFRSAYERKREENPFAETSSQKMMVHIRQGDTAVVKTPWNTYINLWKGKNRWIEYDNPDKARIFKHILVADHYNFLSSLCKFLPSDFFPICVFSDGFKRAYKLLISNEGRLELGHSQIDQLKELEELYDEKEFQLFANHELFDLVIGEDDQKLCRLIDTLLHSDIVVMGTQQRMVPKFLSAYCNPENMPLVIVLFNQVLPSNGGLARHELLSNFLMIDINNHDISKIAEQIKEFLKARKKEK